MSYRLWHAQFDVYDTIRRYLILLAQWPGEAPTRERLFVTDFYLCSPTLLHKSRMTGGVRDAFRQLHVPKEPDQFMRYPAPPLLFERMSGVQNEALANLAGRELVDVPLLEIGQVGLSPAGRILFDRLGKVIVDAREDNLIVFLTTRFTDVGKEVGGLRSVTGLRRVGL